MAPLTLVFVGVIISTLEITAVRIDGTRRDRFVAGETRHPIIISGPLMGQRLEVKDVRPRTKCGNPWMPFYRTAYVSRHPKRLLCAFTKQIRLLFNSTTNLSSSIDGISVRIAPGWDGLKIIGANFDALISHLQKVGYVKDTDIFPMAYDWRLSVRDWQLPGGAFTQFQAAVETAHAQTGKTVVITGLSMAGPFTHAFLRWVRHNATLGTAWLDEHIHAWVPVAAPWNGAVNDFNAVDGGTLRSVMDQNVDLGVAKFECPGCNPKLADRPKSNRKRSSISALAGGVIDQFPQELTNTMRTLPSLYWLFPKIDKSRREERDVSYISVTVDNKTTAYRASQVDEYLRDRRENLDGAAMLEFGLTQDTTRDPQVPVHCVYSFNLPTDQSVDLTFQSGTPEPTMWKVMLGDGDGTVHIDSLRVCENWESLVRSYILPGVVHSQLYTVEQVADVLVAVATDDETKINEWTSPEPDNIRFMNSDGEVEVKNVTEDLYDVELKQPKR